MKYVSTGTGSVQLKVIGTLFNNPLNTNETDKVPAQKLPIDGQKIRLGSPHSWGRTLVDPTTFVSC